jgi:Protein of unknown function (DUF664)
MEAGDRPTPESSAHVPTAGGRGQATRTDGGWLRWGFCAEQLPDPHGDEDQAGRWHAGSGDTAADLIAALHAAGEQTRAIVVAAELANLSAPGGRFSDSDPRPRPTLAWILIYVLQEYARHAGHLDIARELIDGSTGE